MSLTKLNKNSNGQRWSYLYRNLNILPKNLKACKLKIKNSSSRDLLGRVAVRHKQTPYNCYAVKFSTLFYLSRILLVTNFYNFYKNRIPVTEFTDRWGNFYYMRSISGLTFGDTISIFSATSKTNLINRIGSRFFLNFIQLGNVVCNIILSNKKLLSTGRGTYCSVIARDSIYNTTTLLLPSGLKKIVNNNAVCSFGRISNDKAFREIIGKAGLNRKFGFKPCVRGVAMNPVDHPHGGRTKTNSPERSPWGWVTKKGK